MIVKRIACAALALSLLGSTAASAAPWGWHGGWHGGWHHGWRGPGPVFLGVGLGLLTLGAVAAHEDAVERDRYYRDQYYRDRYDRERAYQQDREMRDHGFEPGVRGGPWHGDDAGPGQDHSYRGSRPAPQADEDNAPPPSSSAPHARTYSYRPPADADENGSPPPPPHGRDYRDAPPPPPPHGYDGDGDE